MSNTDDQARVRALVDEIEMLMKEYSVGYPNEYPKSEILKRIARIRAILPNPGLSLRVSALPKLVEALYSTGKWRNYGGQDAVASQIREHLQVISSN